MKKIKFLLIVLLPLFFFSCTNEDEILGLNLVEDADRVNVYGHKLNKVMAFNFHEGDSLKTSNYRYMTMGEYSDNEFGKLTTSIFTQISLSTNSQDFSSSTYSKPDSIVLTMAYTGLFAKDTSIKNMDMKVEVYEITDDFIDSLSYYSNSKLNINPTPIYSSVINISPKQTLVIGGDTLLPHLRVNLGNAFMNKILSLGSIASNGEFKNQIKGFYIKATTTSSSSANGVITYFDMYSSLSGMSLYYRDGNDKTLRYNFVFDDKSKRFSNIEYDFSSSDISSFNTLTSYNDSIDCQGAILNNKMYLGNLGISYIKLNIDSLMNWYKDSTQNIGAFNQVLLTIPVDENYSNNNLYYNFPSRLVAYRKDDNGNFVYIHDAFQAESFDGKFYKANNSYRMRITSHLQNYLNGNIKDPHIYLFPDSRISTASRVVLNGPKHNTNPTKIEIIYTR